MNLATIRQLTYLVTTLLLVIGLYGVIVKRNLIKKLIGLSIFQTAIFLFYIHGATSRGPRCRCGMPVGERRRNISTRCRMC